MKFIDMLRGRRGAKPEPQPDPFFVALGNTLLEEYRTRPTLWRGDYVTCEGGHTIAVVRQDVLPEEPPTTDMFDWAQGVLATTTGCCPGCGAFWVRLRPTVGYSFKQIQLHMSEGWR